MKFYIRLATVVLIVIAGLWYLRQNPQKPPTTPGPNESALAGTSPGPPSPTPSPTLIPLAHPTPIVTPIPTPPTVDPARQVVEYCAKRARVQVVSYRRENSWVRVIVRGYDHNAVVSDFLHELRRNGMRNLDLKQQQYNEFLDPQGRMVYQVGYRVRF